MPIASETYHRPFVSLSLASIAISLPVMIRFPVAKAER
jgi:hypothetical protein